SGRCPTARSTQPCAGSPRPRSSPRRARTPSRTPPPADGRRSSTGSPRPGGSGPPRPSPPRSRRRRTTTPSTSPSRSSRRRPHALAARRARIVSRLPTAGRERLAATLASAEPTAWDDEAFDVRFTLFGTTDARTRLRILEGRHARMVERLAMLRESTQRTRARMDAYTAELARHGLEQVEREVEWLENLIDTERGTPGALDLRTPGPAGSPPEPDRVGSTGPGAT